MHKDFNVISVGFSSSEALFMYDVMSLVSAEITWQIPYLICPVSLLFSF